MRSLRSALPLLLLAAGCDSGLQPTTAFRAELAAVGGSGVSGASAALAASRHSTEVGIELFGAPNTTYGWEVRSGRCGGSGALLGGLAAFPDVTTGPGGQGVIVRVFFSAVMRSEGEYSVVALTADRASVLACGDYQVL